MTYLDIGTIFKHMKKPIGYYLLNGLSLTMNLFPLRFLYLFSTILAVLTYHVFRYRRRVVFENLERAFPEKSEKERIHIAKDFYKYLFDMFTETLYMANSKREVFDNRVSVVPTKEVKQEMDAGRSIIIMLGHVGNWELFNLARMPEDFNVYVVYKELHDKAFDLFYQKTRKRFGSIPLEKKKSYRQLLVDSAKGQKFCVALLSDQNAIPNSATLWANFFGKEVPWMVGAETIARKTNAAVCYASVSRKKRGYYDVQIEMFEKNPQETQKNEISLAYTRRLEKEVRKNPSIYLWSHRRWKHNKAQYVSTNDQ